MQLPEVAPLSASLLDVEAYLPEPGEECQDCVEYSSLKRMTTIPDDFALENDEVRVQFNKKTFMVEQLHFKKLGQTIDLKMSVVRYPSANSDSGAYIFAPRLAEPETLRMVPIDAFLVQSPLTDKLVVFYKSTYMNAVFSMITFQVNHISNKRVLKVDYQFNQLPLDEIFLRFEIVKANGPSSKDYDLD
mmetsp:Transcript_33004/g.50541  ORF Transcript_33004/g.50541 Transcript_33004/m.50541 type:complete len:189 (+) Transcript_33004:2266-2832(+)